MPMQNLHNLEYDHGKVLERERHHSSPNHPIPDRSHNPSENFFKGAGIKANLDLQKVVPQGIWCYVAMQDSNLSVWIAKV